MNYVAATVSPYLPPVALARLTFLVARRSGSKPKPPHGQAVAA